MPGSTPPQLSNGFYVFMDVMGFKDLIEESYASHTENQLFQRFDTSIKAAYQHVDSEDSEYWTTRVFSDNIILTYKSPRPVNALNDLEGEFGSIIDSISRYQLTMILNGFFIRGGWTFGNFYIDDITLFGRAPIDAYQLECEKAKFPRIIISETVKLFVQKHLKSYSDKASAPHNSELLRGEDDIVFINYLSNLIYEDDTVGWEQLEQHRDIVIENLTRHTQNQRVREKYQWVAEYHNYFCSLLSGFSGYDPALLISVTPTLGKFSRLVP